MTSLPVQADVMQSSQRVSNRTVWAFTALAVASTVFLNYTFLSSFGFWEGENAAIYALSFSPLPALISTAIATFMLPFAALNQTRLWLRIVISLFVTLVIWVAIATLLGPAIGQPQHRDSVRVNGHVYNLATDREIFTWTIPVPTVSYLFECDAFGLICHRIYASEPTDTYATKLTADSASGEIQLLGIDGEVLTAVSPDP